MRGFIAEFVSSGFFMPHGHCYLWKPGLVWLQVLTNAFIGVSYFAITLTLVILVRKVRNIPFQWMYLAFGAFIVACGITHLFDILVIWNPLYWMDGGVRAITAVASVGTALTLPTLLPQIKSLADAASLANDRGVQLERANEDLKKARDQLEARVADRTADLVRITADLKAEIGERKRAEEQLRTREEDLAATLDSMGDAVVVTDAQGRVLTMNPVAERLTGYPREHGQGKALEEVFRVENEDTGKPVENPVVRVLREGTVVGLASHSILVTRKGLRIPIADSAAPVRREKGDVRGVILVFRDVTPERRTEEALRHWERIFQHATWGVAVGNAKDLRFQAVNPAYARMHGYTVDELLGAPISRLWPPETRAHMESHAVDTEERGQLIAETVHLCKDGSRLPVEVIATTIKNAQGETAWFVANVQDITERLRLQAVRVRAVELEAENQRIEQANRLKSEFLANMSHELRTPLNSIIGFAELLIDEEVGPLEDKQKEFVGDILAGGRHLLRLINDVLDLAKVEEGKMEFHPEPLELASLVGKLVQSLGPALDAKKLRVDVSVEPSLTDVVLDPSRLKQVLYNYLSNALKFTPEGGRVMVRISAEGADRFRLEVEDTGPGISAENLPRLFVAFQQLESASTKRHAGTGLGLALTKRLTEAQGGTVGMRAAPGRGCVFFAVLPRRTDRKEPTSLRVDLPQAGAVLLRSQERPVLVVDDDVGSLKLMEVTLAKLGYAALCFSDASAALAALDQVRPLAVVLDILMPEVDGLVFLERFRASAENQDIPVMIWTVKDLTTDERRSLQGTVGAILQKGVADGARLSAAMQAFLPPKAARREGDS